MMPKFVSAAHYVQTEKGVYFRFRRQSLHMEGDGIYPFFARILPYLDGTRPLSALLGDLPESHGRILQRLLQALMEKGFVRDMRDATSLNDALRERHATLLAGLEGACPDPEGALLKWLDAHLVITGSAGFVAAARATAVEAGLAMSEPVPSKDGGETTCSYRAGSETENAMDSAACPERYDVVILELADNTHPWLDEVRRQIAANGGWLVPAGVGQDLAFVGPVEARRGGGCLNCATARGTYPEGGRGRFLPRAAGGIALHEAYMHVTGAALVRSHGEICVIKGDDLSITRHYCTPVLDCTRRDFHASATPALGGDETNEEERQRAFLGWAGRHLLDPEFGLLEALDEGALEQVPLHRARATWRNRDRDACLGQALSPVQARIDTVMQVLEAWCTGSHPGFREIAGADDTRQAHAVAGVDAAHARCRAVLLGLARQSESETAWQSRESRKLCAQAIPLARWLARAGVEWRLEFLTRGPARVARISHADAIVVHVAGLSTETVEVSARAELTVRRLQGELSRSQPRFMVADEALDAAVTVSDELLAELTEEYEIHALDTTELEIGLAVLRERDAGGAQLTAMG